ncbi:transglutaminase-like domain-containing protein [Amphibacillus cookii]|uniref:transglutaminase-like domain-containing protein n=1 Tax=Amphibacillus cookii TaxID=767787 RepID=UPI00195DD9A9|nr:transglutaminase family protein [Amphibacillus cookii]MBM7542000.1 transglutaminase-like putative cysteine protease [Amphibacillus cookii]
MLKDLLQNERLEHYLCENELINYSSPIIQALVEELFEGADDEREKVKRAFTFVRDQIAHSWDIQSKRITCCASEVLQYQEGICYAKSHLLAALLRATGIPTGFCYQRLMLFDTPEKGYCIHALNAVYFEALKRWVRIDARGNKPGINAQFSTVKEQLAFAIQPDYDEIDYPTIYAWPNSKTVVVLKKNNNALAMYMNALPEYLQ